MRANVPKGCNELVFDEKGKANPFPLRGLFSTVFQSISQMTAFSKEGTCFDPAAEALSISSYLYRSMGKSLDQCP